MSAQKSKMVPPNGGWGWIIVLGYSLNGISTIPLLQGFGLLFKDIFRRCEFSATEGSIIINTNLAFGMILGLINGPLLHTFGYRKIAVLGSLLYTIGVTATAFVKTFPLFMVFYGIFASLGMTLTMAAFSYALNCYFTTKRGRAQSLALTIIGLGPIIVPQVTTFLIMFYGYQGTIMLYGAFSLHSLIGSVLLHPLKWHAKGVNDQSNAADENTEKKEDKVIDEKSINIQRDENSLNSMLDLSTVKRIRKMTTSSIDYDAEVGSIYGFDILFGRQISETPNDSKRKFQSIESINLGSIMTIFNEKRNSLAKYTALNDLEGDIRNSRDTMENDLMLEKDGTKIALNTKTDTADKTENEKESVMTQILKKIAQLFDLDLLRDPIYVNIMLGMSIAIFAEINFSQLTPFILADMGLSTKEIATVMSLTAMLDLVSRSLASFLGEWLRQPPRIMYLLSLCLLIISRTSILFVDEFIPVLVVAVGLGAAKGIRSVYMTLVLPHYVPIDRLPNASGIQMIVNGIILLTAGPTLGVMRDNIGSYTASIIVMNCVTTITVGMWTIEMFIIRRRKLKLEKSPQHPTC